MNVTTNTLAELTSYLHDLKSMLPSLSLNKKIFKEGTTVGQVAFHTTQSVNFYLRLYILNEDYKRDREAEYTTKHSSEEIIASLHKALDVCKIIIDKNIGLIDRLQKTKTIYSRKFEITTVFEVIQHVTAHTAEHYGQISI